MTHDEFYLPILNQSGINQDHPISQYLSKKTFAVDRGSKARRSLGNLYAILVIAEDFISGHTEGTQFSQLLNRMRLQPFGSKLQNHPLDNRLNDEFSRLTGLSGALLPVQQGNSAHGKTRKISKELLSFNTSDPIKVAEFIVEVVTSFAKIISSGQEKFIEIINGLSTTSDIRAFVEETLDPNSDARLFEVASFCILKHYYSGIPITYTVNGLTTDTTLQLFKTGRTNANDGGIDFVLKPIGRFFQVTETLEFKKYFLDFDKLNRVPITFVIKTDLDHQEVLKRVSDKSKNEISPDLHATYLSLFEEVITNKQLREHLSEILKNEITITSFLNDLIVNFKIEYGHFDAENSESSNKEGVSKPLL
jgi:hypothetical protein